MRPNHGPQKASSSPQLITMTTGLLGTNRGFQLKVSQTSDSPSGVSRKTQRKQNGHKQITRGNFSLWHLLLQQTINSLTPSQINVTPCTKNLPILVPLHHSHLSTKNYKACYKAKTKSEETKRVSEPDSDMIQALELLDWEFKITTINIIRGLQKKLDIMQEQTGNINREMKTWRKNQREMLQIKNTAI